MVKVIQLLSIYFISNTKIVAKFSINDSQERQDNPGKLHNLLDLINFAVSIYFDVP